MPHGGSRVVEVSYERGTPVAHGGCMHPSGLRFGTSVFPKRFLELKRLHRTQGARDQICHELVHVQGYLARKKLPPLLRAAIVP